MLEMRKIKKGIGFMALLLVASVSHGQVMTIDLKQAIRMAQENSFEYKVAKNREQSSLWRFRNFKTTFLPT